ncbi:replication-relaxation family protein [Streptomyces sp. NPDC048665]|uniref:replication-relaxation family protein n=1 Tax=Streptomyces sp. NPDC048665 TaxID=3155490 RepID=UPI0034295ED7
MALGVLTQCRMATTGQMHRMIAPSVRIGQARRRLARLRVEGLVDRITLPRAGQTRVWFPTRTACNSLVSGRRCAGTGPPGPCPTRPPCC